jgi:hypothetical protein
MQTPDRKGFDARAVLQIILSIVVTFKVVATQDLEMMVSEQRTVDSYRSRNFPL